MCTSMATVSTASACKWNNVSAIFSGCFKLFVSGISLKDYQTPNRKNNIKELRVSGLIHIFKMNTILYLCSS